MRTHITLWVIWLLMWAAAGQQQQVCSGLTVGPLLYCALTALPALVWVADRLYVVCGANERRLGLE